MKVEDMNALELETYNDILSILPMPHSIPLTVFLQLGENIRFPNWVLTRVA